MKTPNEIAREIVEEYYHFPEDDRVDCVPKSIAKDIAQAISKERERVLPSREEFLEAYYKAAYSNLPNTLYDWLKLQLEENNGK